MAKKKVYFPILKDLQQAGLYNGKNKFITQNSKYPKLYTFALDKQESKDKMQLKRGGAQNKYKSQPPRKCLLVRLLKMRGNKHPYKIYCQSKMTHGHDYFLLIFLCYVPTAYKTRYLSLHKKQIIRV